MSSYSENSCYTEFFFRTHRVSHELNQGISQFHHHSGATRGRILGILGFQFEHKYFIVERDGEIHSGWKRRPGNAGIRGFKGEGGGIDGNVNKVFYYSVLDVFLAGYRFLIEPVRLHHHVCDARSSKLWRDLKHKLLGLQKDIFGDTLVHFHRNNLGFDRRNLHSSFFRTKSRRNGIFSVPDGQVNQDSTYIFSLHGDIYKGRQYVYLFSL